MKKVLKILKNVLIFIAALFIVFVLFLFVFYGISSNNLKKQEKKAADMAASQPVIAPDTLTSGTPGVLNLIPVPER